jgi:hypothetical protein
MRTLAPAIVMSCALVLLLCQCRCFRACVSFFKSHASTGSDSQYVRSVPSQPMTWDQFLDANRHRGLPSETLRTRFKVADDDGNGILTPEEIQRHRQIAAKNKERRE